MSLGVSEQGDFLAGSATQDQGIIQAEGSFDWDDFGGGDEWGMYVVDPNDSDNGGQSGWTKPYTHANRPPAGKISSSILLTHFRAPDKDTLYITYWDSNPYVPRIEDGGETWESVSGATTLTSLPDIAVTSLVIDPENDDILFVGTEIGVFRSNNAGQSWYF